MQISVTFRQIEATTALKAYASEKLKRIKKYLPDPISVKVVMSSEQHSKKGQRADVNVLLHNGLTIAGHEATDDMYGTIDQVVAKIEAQVRRYKDKLRSHKKSSLESIPWVHSVIKEGPGDSGDIVRSEDAPESAHAVTDAVTDAARSGTDSGVGADLSGPVIKKAEKFHAEPMSVSDAIMRMNLSDEQFLVFRCQQGGGVNVVYRRNDDSFGLIETPSSS